jgi:hypothetical protein
MLRKALAGGLCVITTRIPVADIADHERTSARRRGLEQLKETLSQADLEELAKGFQDLRETYLRDCPERMHRYDTLSIMSLK